LRPGIDSFGRSDSKQANSHRERAPYGLGVNISKYLHFGGNIGHANLRPSAAGIPDAGHSPVA
jgi:hypothetical protein